MLNYCRSLRSNHWWVDIETVQGKLTLWLWTITINTLLWIINNWFPFHSVLFFFSTSERKNSLNTSSSLFFFSLINLVQVTNSCNMPQTYDNSHDNSDIGNLEKLGKYLHFYLESYMNNKQKKLSALILKMKSYCLLLLYQLLISI